MGLFEVVKLEATISNHLEDHMQRAFGDVNQFYKVLHGLKILETPCLHPTTILVAGPSLSYKDYIFECTFMAC